jgi:hypothetical protein
LQDLLRRGGVPMKKAEAMATWGTDCQFDYLEEICSNLGIDIKTLGRLDAARADLARKTIKRTAKSHRDNWAPKMFPEFEREASERRAHRQSAREIVDILECLDAKAQTYADADIDGVIEHLPKSALQRDVFSRRIDRVLELLRRLETSLQRGKAEKEAS